MWFKQRSSALKPLTQNFVFLFILVSFSGCQTSSQQIQKALPPNPYEQTFFKLSDSDKLSAKESVYSFFLLQFSTFIGQLQNLRSQNPLIQDDPVFNLPPLPPFHYARFQNGVWRFDFEDSLSQPTRPTQIWEWVLSIEVGGWLLAKHLGFQNHTRGMCFRAFRQSLRKPKSKFPLSRESVVFDPRSLKSGPELEQIISQICMGLGSQTLELISVSSHGTLLTAKQNPQYEAWILQQTELQSQKILSAYQSILL